MTSSSLVDWDPLRAAQCTGLALGAALLELVSGPELPVLRLFSVSGSAPVFAVLGVASVGSPAPGPVVMSGPVLPGEFTLLASLAGWFDPTQATLRQEHRSAKSAPLSRIMTSSLSGRAHERTPQSR